MTGNTYRNPALLAKIVTALDIVSGGRAQLGIGAGWFEVEHDSLGFEFGTFTDRFEKLEEALQIILPHAARRATDASTASHYQRHAKPSTSRRRSGRIPVMIGGGGETQDPAARRAVRRRVEPDVTVARDTPQARRARRALRTAGA